MKDEHKRNARYATQRTVSALRAAHLGLAQRVAAPPANAQPPVYQRSATLAAQWVLVRERTCVNLAGYIATHAAGQQYSGYWTPSEVQQADQQVTKP
jgi:hypothetical protein